MIKIEEIVEKYKGYEVDEEKLKEFLIPPKPKTVWDLKNGDRYWYLDDYDGVTFTTWNNDEVDITRRLFCNCFLTKEETEFEVERRKVEAILLKYGRKEFKYGEDNYYMHCEYNKPPFEIGCYDSYSIQGVIYFDTKELCLKAIKEAERNNIDKYIFGVEN